MKLDNLLVLRDVINSIQEYPWEDWLFLPQDENWHIDTKCAVLNLDDLDDEEEVPMFANENALKLVLNISDVQDIVENYLQNHKDATIDDLFNAVMYYFKHDAFIE